MVEEKDGSLAGVLDGSRCLALPRTMLAAAVTEVERVSKFAHVLIRFHEPLPTGALVCLKPVLSPLISFHI